MKLKQFLSNQFNEARLFFNERKYFKILDQHIGEIFPMQADIDKNLKKLLQNHKTKNMQNIDVLMPYLLPMHIRDDAWMATYVNVMTSFVPEATAENTKQKQDNLKEIPFDIIKSYIAKSPKFEQQRCQYEEKVVRGCIAYCQVNEKELSMLDSVMYDDFFRSRIVYSALKLGLERETIECALEKNAHLWRKNAMLQTFANQIKIEHPNYLRTAQRDALYNLNQDCWESFVSKELRYLDLWMRKQENDYYRAHKSVIDKTGTATPNMNLDVFATRTLNLDVLHAKNQYTDALSVINEDLEEMQAYQNSLKI